jgi:phage-related minor tail protein
MTIETIEQESESLPTHVSLCAQRYHALETRLDKVEASLDDLAVMVKDYIRTTRITIIQAVAAIIVAGVTATGTIVAVILNHPLK